MKTKLLPTALLTLLSTVAHADVTQQTGPTTSTAQAIQAPTAAPAIVTTPTTPKTPLVINCEYPIAASTKTVDESIISTWASFAAVQSFNFNPTEIDAQLLKLKSCYTDPGWAGFHDALDKSGNITAIKSQNLTVSSQVDGKLTINAIKDNQWKVNLPLQVVYQNDKERLTQLLSIDLVIGRKMSGNLGIMQVIATPRNVTAVPVNKAS